MVLMLKTSIGDLQCDGSREVEIEEVLIYDIMMDLEKLKSKKLSLNIAKDKRVLLYIAHCHE